MKQAHSQLDNFYHSAGTWAPFEQRNEETKNDRQWVPLWGKGAGPQEGEKATGLNRQSTTAAHRRTECPAKAVSVDSGSIL